MKTPQISAAFFHKVYITPSELPKAKDVIHNMLKAYKEDKIFSLVDECGKIYSFSFKEEDYIDFIMNAIELNKK